MGRKFIVWKGCTTDSVHATAQITKTLTKGGREFTAAWLIRRWTGFTTSGCLSGWTCGQIARAASHRIVRIVAIVLVSIRRLAVFHQTQDDQQNANQTDDSFHVKGPILGHPKSAEIGDRDPFARSDFILSNGYEDQHKSSQNGSNNRQSQFKTGHFERMSRRGEESAFSDANTAFVEK